MKKSSIYYLGEVQPVASAEASLGVVRFGVALAVADAVYGSLVGGGGEEQ